MRRIFTFACASVKKEADFNERDTHLFNQINMMYVKDASFSFGGWNLLDTVYTVTERIVF